MIGGNPWWLLGLWLLPLLAGLLYHAHRRTAAAARQFAGGLMVDRLMPEPAPLRPWIRGGLLLLGIGLLIVAAARPRFGAYYEQVTSRGVDLFVLLDVSRSMLAEDVAPHRLGRARSDIRDLLKQLPGDRVGLIAFAGAPALVVPLTTDQGFFLSALDAVDTDSAPRGGSLIGDAIRKALQSLEQRRDRDQVLVLITDGEDHDSFPLEAAEQAAERGVRIFTVGLGDPDEGMRIPIRDESGELRYLEHEGQVVRSRMDEQLLKDIALATRGAYVPARTRAYDLGRIYQEHLAKLTRGEIQSERQKRYAERFQWFLFFGLAALLAQMLVSPYPPAAAARPAGTRRRKAAAAVLLVAASLAAQPEAAEAGIREAADRVRAGLQLFSRGEYKAAEERFAEAEAELPEDPRIAFNRGCAAAAAGEVDQAIPLFRQAGLARDPQLAAGAHYNLGGLAAEQGRAVFGERPEDAAPELREQGLEHLQRAIRHWRDCLEIDPEHAAARHNLELLRTWIKQMQDVWAARDRQQQREAMGLLELLEMIQQRQQQLRAAARQLAAEDDSPRRRQALGQAAGEQRRLMEEFPTLEDKLREAFQPQATAIPLAVAGAADAARALDLLLELAGQARRAMSVAADDLDGQAPAEAAEHQARALDRLNQIFTLIASAAQLVQKAIAVQEPLIEATRQAAAPAAEESQPPFGAASTHQPDAQARDPSQHRTRWRAVPPFQPDAQARDSSLGEPPPPGAASPPGAVPPLSLSPPEASELARVQATVHGWSRILPDKAEHELQQLPPEVAGPPRREDLERPEDSADAAAAAQDPRAALEKALELGPQIEQLTDRATERLEQNRPDQALPPQEEALKLLKEIADLLPQQPQEQPDQPEDQAPQSPQEQPEQPQEKSSDQPSSRESPEPEQISQQQAEALMQRVRERERQHRELQKQLRKMTVGGVVVERDW